MNAQAAGFGDTLYSSIIDTQDSEGTVFLVMLGAIAATAVVTLAAQGGAASNLSDAATLAGTNIPVTASDDNKVLILDVKKAQERYIRLKIVRATANITIDGVFAMQYGGRKVPTTHDATTVAGAELHVSPEEGSA